MQIIGVVNIWIEVLLFAETPQLKTILQPFHLHCTMPENKSKGLEFICSAVKMLLDKLYKPSQKQVITNLNFGTMLQTSSVENSGCIMGRVGSGVFEVWHILENENPHILAFAAPILTILSEDPTWFKHYIK